MPGDFDHSVVNATAHRPWPMPSAPWVMTQTWHDVLFAHWPVAEAVMRARVPRPFELDTFDGVAWLSVVAFHMTNVSPRGVPSLPWLSAFPELNVRTYVRVNDRPGVYFFSLDAASWPAVQAANLALNLPYYWADMQVERADAVRYQSARRSSPADFTATYAPCGAPAPASPGSLDHFLTERYCLYHVHHTGTPYRLEIHHPPWPLSAAKADIQLNSVASNVIPSSGEEPPALLHFAERQDVVVWTPEHLPVAPAAG